MYRSYKKDIKIRYRIYKFTIAKENMQHDTRTQEYKRNREEEANGEGSCAPGLQSLNRRSGKHRKDRRRRRRASEVSERESNRSNYGQ